MAAMLEVSNLKSWYGESQALHGVDLTVGEGETITILGRNGVGKTTTLRTIMGIIRNRKGVIKLGGKDLMPVPLHRTAKYGLGFVPEERGHLRDTERRGKSETAARRRIRRHDAR